MRFLKYVSVQVVAYGLDIGAFVFFSSALGIQPLFANLIGKLIAGGFAYLAHSFFTFEVGGHGAGHGRVVKYVLLLAINAPLATAVLGLVLLADWGLIFSKFISDVACVVLTYWLSKKYIFSAGSEATSAPISEDEAE